VGIAAALSDLGVEVLTGEIPKAMCFSTLVLMPKADRQWSPGNWLLEVAWKVMSGIVQ
jgi:hypothetical protein